MDEPGLFGVAERLFKVRTRKTDFMTDALGSPPRMRGLALRRWSWVTNAAAR